VGKEKRHAGLGRILVDRGESVWQLGVLIAAIIWMVGLRKGVVSCPVSGAVVGDAVWNCTMVFDETGEKHPNNGVFRQVDPPNAFSGFQSAPMGTWREKIVATVGGVKDPAGRR
jgi:hypothetical protein